MPSQLLQNLRTKEDLEILRGELDLLENALYQTNDKYDDIIKNDIRNWVSEIIKSESKEVDIKKYLKQVKESLASVPILSACISFEPSEDFVEKLSLWLKSNLSPEMVVDLLFNTQIIGGIQLSYMGKYIDLSLRKKITAEMTNMTLKTA